MAQTTIQPQLPLLRRALSDATIHNAVKLWINGGPTEKKEIEKLYGNNFGEWNTSLVTDMSALFQNQERFNEGVSLRVLYSTSVLSVIVRLHLHFNRYSRPLVHLKITQTYLVGTFHA